MVEFSVPEVDYTRYSNRQLVAVPLAVLGLALLVLVAWYLMTGAPVTPGFEFTGGTEIRFATADTQAQIRETFASIDVESIRLMSAEDTYLLQTQATDLGRIRSLAEGAGYDVRSVQSVSASFGASSRTQALWGMAIAFVGMSVLVFVLFRTFVPSIAVVASALSDILIPLALMNLFGIKLSLGAVAALLMLIGYSVDSDLLLNNHVLRRQGAFYESAYRAMRTGVTMTLTSIAAMVTMTIVARLLAIPLLPDVGIILVFGLTADLMNTYMLNMSLLRWYKYEGVTR